MISGHPHNRAASKREMGWGVRMSASYLMCPGQFSLNPHNQGLPPSVEQVAMRKRVLLLSGVCELLKLAVGLLVEGIVGVVYKLFDLLEVLGCHLERVGTLQHDRVVVCL